MSGITELTKEDLEEKIKEPKGALAKIKADMKELQKKYDLIFKAKAELNTVLGKAHKRIFRLEKFIRECDPVSWVTRNFLKPAMIWHEKAKKLLKGTE